MGFRVNDKYSAHRHSLFLTLAETTLHFAFSTPLFQHCHFLFSSYRYSSHPKPFTMHFSSEETRAEQSELIAISAFLSPAQLEELQANLHESPLHNTVNLSKEDRGRPARIDALRNDSVTDDASLHARKAASSGATSSRGLSPLPFQRPWTFLERVSHHQSELRCAGGDAFYSPPSVEINGDELIMADVASVA